MRLRVFSVFFAAIVISACSGSSGLTPPPLASPPTGAPSSFALTPSSVDLSPSLRTDTFNGQGDTADVSYTPSASPACSISTGSIVVAGNGVAQLDVAGSPLLFTVAAVGTSPPLECEITVTGSDGSVAMVVVNYSNPPVTDVPDASAHRLHVTSVTRTAGSVTPTALSFSALVAQNLTVSGFTGNVSASVTCASKSSGLTISPSQAGNGGTFTLIPYGQGSITNTCTITLSDQSKNSTTVNAALSIGALARLTATPKSVQFGCAGTSAPYNCQSSPTIAVAESGTHTYHLVTRSTLANTCANVFYGPLTMTTDGKTFAQSVTGSSVTVTFAGLLTALQSLPCSAIVITDDNVPAERVRITVNPALAAPSSGLAAASAPACTGTDGRVAVPTAPHGMYVWNPYQVDGGKWESYLEQYVIGKDASGKPKDPNICGVSLLVEWSEVEKIKGTFDWSKVITQAMPYFNAGLSVNLLFIDASETGANNTATPSWVTDPSGDDVAVVHCNGQVPAPNFMDPTYEADWESLISAAVTEFTVAGNSPINAQVGYLRFGIGAGTEAYAAHMTGNSAAATACLALWQSTIANGGANWTYDRWVTHTRHILNYVGSFNTNGHQFMAAMNEIPDYPNTIYDYSNAEAFTAANNGIGFGTENLGIGHVADVGAKPTPAPCNPQANNGSIYWCQAFTRHAGVVPFEFQPIEAVADPLVSNGALEYNIDFTKMLQYALVNNTQIFELYPQDWLEADDPSVLPAAMNNPDQKTWKAAMSNTAVTVGAQQP